MISASVSWLIGVAMDCGPPSLPKFAIRRRVRASRFSLVEELVDQVFLDPAVARQKMRHEELGKARLGLKNAKHLGLAHPHDLAVGHGLGRCQTQALADQAAFAKELARAQDTDHRFLALLRCDDNLDPAFLDVENSVRDSRLPEDHVILVPVGHDVPATDRREKGFWIEGGLGFPGHDSSSDDLTTTLVINRKREVSRKLTAGPGLSLHEAAEIHRKVTADLSNIEQPAPGCPAYYVQRAGARRWW